MEVVLIRHTSVAVPKGTCYGQTDVPVADTFEQEAAATRAVLGRYGQFDAVFSSPLTRARLLAAACGYEQPVRELPVCLEFIHGLAVESQNFICDYV